jgi:hypothetical protein
VLAAEIDYRRSSCEDLDKWLSLGMYLRKDQRVYEMIKIAVPKL